MDQHRIERIAAAVRRAIEMCEPTELPWPRFPLGACGDSALVLGQVLDDEGIKGFMYVYGNKYHSDGSPYSHAWLRRDEWIIDITADQFVDVHEPVIVTNNSEWHGQWELQPPEPGTLREYGSQVPHLWSLLAVLKPRLQF